MDRWISTAKYTVLSLFLAASMGAAGYEMYYVWPARKCEQHGAWWDARDRQCLTPIPIWRITQRALGAYPAPISGAPPGPTAHPPAPSH